MNRLFSNPNATYCDIDAVDEAQNPMLSIGFEERFNDRSEFTEVFYSQANQTFSLQCGSENLDSENPQMYSMVSVNNFKKPCNCTKSHCLKLYCECFARGSACDNCNCKNCMNNIMHEEARNKAVKMTLDKNPAAFYPKIGENDRRHIKGCNCKRSGCLKNYCECYEAKIHCSELCKCKGCRNYGADCPMRDNTDEVLLLLSKNCPGFTNDTSNILDEQSRVLREHNGGCIKAPFSCTSYRTAPYCGTYSYPNENCCVTQIIPREIMTSEVVQAACSCMLSRLDEAKSRQTTQEVQEHVVLEEFGKCLEQIIDSASKLNNVVQTPYCPTQDQILYQNCSLNGSDYIQVTASSQVGNHGTNYFFPNPSQALFLESTGSQFGTYSSVMKDQLGYVDTVSVPVMGGLNQLASNELCANGFYELADPNTSHDTSACMQYIPMSSCVSDNRAAVSFDPAHTYLPLQDNQTPVFNVDHYNYVNCQQEKSSNAMFTSYIPRDEQLISEPGDRNTANHESNFAKVDEDQEVKNATAALLNVSSEQNAPEYLISGHFDPADCDELQVGDSIYLNPANHLADASNFMGLHQQDPAQFQPNGICDQPYRHDIMQQTPVLSTREDFPKQGTFVLKPEMGYFTFTA